MVKLDKKEIKTMKPFTKCPTCGGELQTQTVEKIIRGGKHTAVLKVEADTCTHCGERLYSDETVRYFEKIRGQLKRQEFSDLQPLGQSFLAAGSTIDEL